MEVTSIENEYLRVTVAPLYGARVVNLVDKATGREWMAQGGYSPHTGEDTKYLADEAVGWDECFPTVAPWDASDTAWGRPLRDHGDVWGREWDTVHSSQTELSLRYVDPQFILQRRLLLDGPKLVAEYRLDNRSGSTLPYLWALHALLAVTESDRIDLGGVKTTAATYVSRKGTTLSVPSLLWPGPNKVWPEMLNRVQPVSSQRAAKLYASGLKGGGAAIGHGSQWLQIDWDESIDDLGIWLNFGGWPTPGQTHHVALEPTTAPVDHLGEALQRPNPVAIQPGGSRSWSVTFSVALHKHSTESAS
jgi:galactose mutarotase-like enzyme